MIIGEEDALEHFGVKGMRWGSRKSSSSGSGGSSGRGRRAAKIGGAVLVTGGAIAGAALLARNGHLPPTALHAATANKGKEAAARLADQAVWKSHVSSVLKDMHEANAEQDRYMRGLGLGAHLNAAKKTTTQIKEPLVNVYADRLKRAGLI